MSEQNVEMKIDPARAKHLVSNLQHISERVAKASKASNVSFKVPIHLSSFLVTFGRPMAFRMQVLPNEFDYGGVVPGA